MTMIRADGKVIGTCKIYWKPGQLKIKRVILDAEYQNKDITAIDFCYAPKKKATKKKKEEKGCGCN